MIRTLTGWLKAPYFSGDEDKTRRALLLNAVLNTFLIAMPILIVGALVGGQVPRLERSMTAIFIAWLIAIFFRFFLRAGLVSMTGKALVGLLFITTTLVIYNLGTIRAPATSFYILTIVMAGLTISRRAIVFMTSLSLVSTMIFLLAEMNGFLPEPSLAITITQGVSFSVAFAFISILLFLAVRSIDEALARARRELTERQNSESRLRASEERFRAMIDNISDAIALVDDQDKIFYLSPTSERILGYTIEERIGFSVFENLPWQEDVLKLQKILGELVGEPGATRSFVLRARHKDGSTRWLEATAKNLLDMESIRAIVVNYRDITDRIRAEEERESYVEVLGKQNAELERFTYTVSHDLRNPLVTIKGFLGMLEQDLKDNQQEKIYSDLRRISGAADKMNALLSELLEFSRVGRFLNPAEQVNIAGLVEEAVELLDARIRSKTFTLIIQPNLPTVSGDRIRLREVFENLIDNAAKYTGNQTSPRIEIGFRDGREPVFFVKDNGMGIEPEYQEKIFGLFNKLDPTSEGTGVGLALIKRIIEMHGGKIWMESDGLNKGTTFCFTIPSSPQTR